MVAAGVPTFLAVVTSRQPISITAPATLSNRMSIITLCYAALMGSTSPAIQWQQKSCLQAAKLTLVDAIRSNTNMASTLCAYHANAGSWDKLLSDLEQVDTLTASDIQTLAAAVFAQDNCYTGYMLKS